MAVALSLFDQRQLAEVLPWSQFAERGLFACLVFRRQLHPPLRQHQKRIADHVFCEQRDSGGEFPFNRDPRQDFEPRGGKTLEKWACLQCGDRSHAFTPP